MTAEPKPAPQAQPLDLADLRVTVIGLGRFGGGTGVTRWLCGQGAKVIVSDAADADALADSVRQLRGLDVTLHLGAHDERDVLDADLLVVNPAVPKDIALLARADRAGVPKTTEINLFLERCRSPVAGVTGTVGKSTTTAMLGEILARRFTTHVGGNIGVSLLDRLGEIAADHVAVLELSSFQLASTPLVGISPRVALVTNIEPNHLDRHGTYEAYVDAKKNIFRFQGDGDVLLLNADCADLADWAAPPGARTEFFDPAGEPFELALPGAHNQANAQAAWAAAREFGVDRVTAAAALRDFAALPHRLQFVAERDGVRYCNDSKCTTPGGAVVALDAFETRTAVIIVGGYDKGTSFEKLARAIVDRAKALIALGATRQRIVDAVEACRTGDAPTVDVAADLAEAVAIAKRQARPGDTVLLSPACASYDMFTNYEHRGAAFVELVTGATDG